MKIKNKLITNGFILSGLTNIGGVLILSRFFNNHFIPDFDSQAMSNFGLLMIVIWGLVFISVSKRFYKVKPLIGVFAIEKFIYATHWTSWLVDNDLSTILNKDKMAGIFYAVYGINDWLFFVFFLAVFIYLSRTKLDS